MASARPASVVPRKSGMNAERTITALISFIAAIPAAWGMRPSAVMMKVEKAK